MEVGINGHIFGREPSKDHSTVSIFSNSGHVGWCMASTDTILKLDTLVMIQTKFGFHWSSTFRGEDFFKSYDVRQTLSDGNSSHDPLGQVS